MYYFSHQTLINLIETIHCLIASSIDPASSLCSSQLLHYYFIYCQSPCLDCLNSYSECHQISFYLNNSPLIPFYSNPFSFEHQILFYYQHHFLSQILQLELLLLFIDHYFNFSCLKRILLLINQNFHYLSKHSYLIKNYYG